MTGRAWGIWTQGKLEILRRYLDSFTTACKRSPEIVYLDLFGGQPDNVDRITRDPIEGSARIALQADNPPFTRLRFFELDQQANRLRDAITSEFPARDTRVYPGDCNQTIKDALADLVSVNWAPTFAFIDPNGPHAHWTTLEALAQHKPARLRTKVEFWLLFPVPMFIRMLPSRGQVLQRENEAIITAMFGTDDWHPIYAARLAETIDPSQAREEYVELMRWRIETVLGYRTTHDLEVRNESGRPIYNMIFATDSDPGDRIMTNLYDHAADEFPAMLQEARLRRRALEEKEHGVMSLFGDEPAPSVTPRPREPGERLYQHVPPSEPRRSHDHAACPICRSL